MSENLDLNATTPGFIGLPACSWWFVEDFSCFTHCLCLMLIALGVSMIFSYCSFRVGEGK